MYLKIRVIRIINKVHWFRIQITIYTYAEKMRIIYLYQVTNPTKGVHLMYLHIFFFFDKYDSFIRDLTYLKGPI